MAIALDVASNGSATSTSPLAWNHTCTGSNLVLIVGVTVYAGSPPNCSGVTYNGTALTLLDIRRTLSSIQSSLWYLLAPDTGSHQISVSFTGTAVTCNAGAVSWSGVKQTDQPDAVSGTTNNTQNPSVTVTTVADNCWVAGILTQMSLTPTAGLTNRWTGVVGAARGSFEDTNGPKTPAGNQAVNWTTVTSGSGWAIQAASFVPAITVYEANKSDAISTSESKNVTVQNDVYIGPEVTLSRGVQIY